MLNLFGTGKRYFVIFAARSWSHSSMDRIQDSGSCDLGSSPGGITKAADYQWPFVLLYPESYPFVILLVQQVV